MNRFIRALGRAATDIVGAAIEGGTTAALTASGADPVTAQATGAASGAAVRATPDAVASLFLGDQEKKIGALGEMAADAAGLTLDELAERLLVDEQHRNLLGRAVRAAQDAADEVRLRGLAGALASGALTTDEAVVDELLVAVDVLGRLDAKHIRTMALLATVPPDPAQYHQYTNFRPWPWTPDQIYAALPTLGRVMPAVLARMEAEGVIREFPSQLVDFQDGRLQLTPFGELCLQYLEGLASEPEPAAA